MLPAKQAKMRKEGKKERRVTNKRASGISIRQPHTSHVTGVTDKLTWTHRATISAKRDSDLAG
jgi:hypothetical protein